MIKQIRVKCPAKINLTLRVYKKDELTGFHDIDSIMQAINLFDFLTIKIEQGDEIILSGNSDEIPYNQNNLCYKAAKLFLNTIQKKAKVEIKIEKNIPVCAGLAGGSTDAAGVLYGLNKLFSNLLNELEINKLASQLGSDLNFCLVGGTKLCKGRGEKITNMPFYDFKLSLVKPKNLKISAKEAYCAFDELKEESNMRNDLEFALLDKYDELKFLSSKGLQMSGSGPTYFLRDKNIDFQLDKDKYLVINNLNSISYGVVDV